MKENFNWNFRTQSNLYRSLSPSDATVCCLFKTCSLDKITKLESLNYEKTLSYLKLSKKVSQK